MKTLLVPTDFSESAENAINYAIEFAHKDHSKIILLHSDELDYQTLLYTLMVPANESIKKEALKLLEASAARISRNGNIENECVVKDSALSDAILSTAIEKNVDMIIMGTKGAHGIKKFLVGSNTSTIIEKAHCPVLAVPDHAYFKGIRKITYATDYHESDLPAFQKLLVTANLFDAQLEILHISPHTVKNDPAEKEKMLEFLKKLPAAESVNISHKILEGDDITKQFDAIMATGGTSLLVMNTRQRFFLEKLLSGSLSKEISYHAKIPLLVFHHAKQPIVF